MKAVLFDFDYTLGDSTKGIVISANYAMEKLGYAKKDEEEICKTIGLTLKETFFVLEPMGGEDNAALYSTYFKEKADEVMTGCTQLYPNTVAVLQTLKDSGYKIGIVTTKYRHRIEGILDKFHISDLVDEIVGSDNVRNAKPNPEGIEILLKKWNLSKEEILYVGDSLVDAKTAKNAGVSFVAVLTGTTNREEFSPYSCLYIANEIQEIVDIVKKEKDIATD